MTHIIGRWYLVHPIRADLRRQVHEQAEERPRARVRAKTTWPVNLQLWRPRVQVEAKLHDNDPNN